MKIRMIIFIFSFLTWSLLSWSVAPGHLITGVAVGIFITFMTSDLFEQEPRIFKKPSRYLWFLCYIPMFVWECIKANIDGVYRVAHPDLPINPGVVKVRTVLRSDLGLTFLANSLTLKPGTMTIDIDRERGFIYVHWVDVRSQDIEKATEMIVRRFENILKRIFE